MPTTVTNIEFESTINSSMLRTRQPSNNVVFNQSVKNNIIEVEASNSINFSYSTRDNIIEIGASSTVDFSHSTSNNITEVDASNNVEFNRVLDSNIKTELVNNTIEFGSGCSTDHKIENHVEFDQTITYTVTREAGNSITFSHTTGHVGSIFKRNVSSSISFNSFATAYKSSDNPHYIQPSPDYPNPPDPTNPDCEIRECDLIRVHFIQGATDVELRCPETTETLVSNAVEHYTVAKEIKQVNRNNNFRQLDLNFTGMPQNMRDAFRQFYIDTAGQEVTYLDDCGNTWVGIIISEEIDFNQSGNGYVCPEGTGVFEFQFKFEGVVV